MEEQSPIRIHHFSDILCVWAYVAQRRLDELLEHFGDAVEISYHFVPIFGCPEKRIGEGWASRGGWDGFSEHVCSVVAEFDHVTVTPDVWRRCRPYSSASLHLYLKAVELVGGSEPRADGKRPIEAAAWMLREAFFVDGRDVCSPLVQREITRSLDLSESELKSVIEDGQAMAQMCRDLDFRDEFKVRGSPTFVLDEGRQVLYGNVGYRVIEANVEELLRVPHDQASWC